MSQSYYTTGQIAKELRVSVSTLKRWLAEENQADPNPRNAIGWRLFTQEDLDRLRMLKQEKKRNGKQYSADVLVPVF
jgi:DNA-binding transcriptional MerR regulator